MPLVIYFREPNISLIVKGELDAKRKKTFIQALGEVLEFDSIEGDHKILIPVSNDKNITYISTITDEEFEELKKQREAKRARNIIERPQMVIPTVKRRQ